MNSVKVDRLKLMETVKANRLQHAADYEKAMAGYREELLALLDKMMDMVRDNKTVPRVLEVEEPRNHSDDYDTSIAMLDASVEPVVEIDKTTFTNLYLDNWDWKEQWAVSNSKYLGRGK